MDFSSLFEVVEKYGWGAVGMIGCIGFILIMTVAAIKYLNAKMTTKIDNKIDSSIEDMQNQISTTLAQSLVQLNTEFSNLISDQNKKLIDYIVDSKTNETEKHSDMLAHRMKMSSEINTRIKDIMNLYNAQRVSILEFHNSYQNLSGIPFAKYSCTYEWFMPGVMPLANDCKAMSFSSISPIVDEIIASGNNQIIYDDIKEIEELSPGLYSLLSQKKAKAVIFNAMYDEKNSMVGLVCLEYHHKIPKHIDLDNIKIDTAQITSILNLKSQLEA